MSKFTDEQAESLEKRVAELESEVNKMKVGINFLASVLKELDEELKK